MAESFSAITQGGQQGIDLMMRHAPPISFLDYLLANPVVIAGAFAGAVTIFVGMLTFIGVRITVNSAERRMTKELEHDTKRAADDREESRIKSVTDRAHSADEAQRERLATARRAVYLDAAKQLAMVSGYLGRLATVDLANPGPDDNLTGMQSAVTQVGVVSEHDTAMKARELGASLIQIFLQALPRVMPIAALKAQATVSKEYFDIAIAERKRIAKAMAEFNESTDKDDRKWKLLQISSEGQEKIADAHEARRREAEDQMSLLRRQYAAWIMPEINKLTTPMNEMACAIRAELGLESNLAAFEEQSARLSNMLLAELERMGQMVPTAATHDAAAARSPT